MTSAHPHRQEEDFPVAVIGASTGGPPLIQQILEGLPKNPHACVLIAQHMPPHFTAQMSERLARLMPFPVRQARNGERLASGTVLIAPGDQCMEIARDQSGEPIVRVSAACQTSKEATPSIDSLMQSAAKILGKCVTGFILSGMGKDGALGMQFIRRLGHHTYAQDPSTCVVDSMVQYAIGCDGVDAVIRPEQIATIISRLT